jgi:hypothetical protein
MDGVSHVAVLRASTLCLMKRWIVVGLRLELLRVISNVTICFHIQWRTLYRGTRKHSGHHERLQSSSLFNFYFFTNLKFVEDGKWIFFLVTFSICHIFYRPLHSAAPVTAPLAPSWLRPVHIFHCTVVLILFIKHQHIKYSVLKTTVISVHTWVHYIIMYRQR